MLEDCRKVRSWLINFKHLSSPWTNSVKAWLLQTTGGAYVCSMNMQGIGRSRGVCLVHAPLWNPILSFLHTFSPKSAHIGGPCPPQWVHTPYGKSWICHCGECTKRIVHPQIPVVHSVLVESLGRVVSVPQMGIQSVVLSLQ